MMKQLCQTYSFNTTCRCAAKMSYWVFSWATILKSWRLWRLLITGRQFTSCKTGDQRLSLDKVQYSCDLVCWVNIRPYTVFLMQNWLIDYRGLTAETVGSCIKQKFSDLLFHKNDRISTSLNLVTSDCVCITLQLINTSHFSFKFLYLYVVFSTDSASTLNPNERRSYKAGLRSFRLHLQCYMIIKYTISCFKTKIISIHWLNEHFSTFSEKNLSLDYHALKCISS